MITDFDTLPRNKLSRLFNIQKMLGEFQRTSSAHTYRRVSDASKLNSHQPVNNPKSIHATPRFGHQLLLLVKNALTQISQIILQRQTNMLLLAINKNTILTFQSVHIIYFFYSCTEGAVKICSNTQQLKYIVRKITNMQHLKKQNVQKQHNGG